MTIVSDFLLAYSSYFSDVVDRGDDPLIDESARAWVEMQRLVESGLTEADLMELEARYQRRVPEEVAALRLSKGTPIPLDGPLFMLLATGGRQAKQELADVFEAVNRPDLLPVGKEQEDWGLGYYCVQLGECTGQPLVYFPHPKLERGPLSMPLFSSFSAMLRVNTFLLRRFTETATPTPLSPNEVDALRRMDPIFGGTAWDLWWARRFA